MGPETGVPISFKFPFSALNSSLFLSLCNANSIEASLDTEEAKKQEGIAGEFIANFEK